MEIKDEKKELVLEAYLRKEKGKSYAHKLRKRGFIPAIVYGKGLDKNLMIEVNYNDAFYKFTHFKNFKDLDFNLKVKDKETGNLLNTYKVKVKDIQLHPFKTYILHIDFQIQSNNN